MLLLKNKPILEHIINRFKLQGYKNFIIATHYLGNKITNYFNKGKKCSWHFHKIKQETFYLQKGKIKVWFGHDDDIKKAKEIIIEPGQSFEVPIGLRHQILGLEDSDMFEFSTTHSETDSHRITKGD